MRITVDKLPAKLPVGWTLKNPGNIFHADGNAWHGAAEVQPHKEIMAFVDPRWGLRAMMRLLTNYQARHKIDTIAAIISRYAPAADRRNHTRAYIAFVAKVSGIPENVRINLAMSGALLRVVPTMVRFELGFQPFPASVYVRACEDAGIEVDL